MCSVPVIPVPDTEHTNFCLEIDKNCKAPHNAQQKRFVTVTVITKYTVHVRPPYSRTKIYAARMSCGSIDICCLRLSDLSSKAAGRRCCCRSTAQTDGQTNMRICNVERVITQQTANKYNIGIYSYNTALLPISCHSPLF